jgi:hypothetical protein
VALLTSDDAFGAWAPADVIWSEWAKPVAFVKVEALSGEPRVALGVPQFPLPVDSSSAVIVDLPGAEAVEVGLFLADRGFCPVPLFNGTSGPSAVVDVLPITRALIAGVERLRTRPVSPSASPAFLLDSRRKGDSAAVKPGAYDNRWVALPQDFPSGALIASKGIRTATVIQRDSLSVAADLAHVLRRWQDHGIVIRVVDVASARVADRVTIPKPSGFRLAWYAAIALLGLRRSNVGGFGSQVPQQTARGGYYG